MNRALIQLVSISVFAVGCGRAAVTAPGGANEAKSAKAPDAQATKAADGDATAADGATLTADDSEARKPGDFVVFRFSGSFRKTPLTMSERVIAREGDAIVVAVIADDGKTKRELRVRLGDSAAHKNEILSVAKIQDGKEQAATVADFEALALGIAADTNEAVLGSEEIKLKVGKGTIDAKRTSYRVKVGSKHATLSTLESPSFAWGDLGGELKTDSGKVLYKAEVVDAGHADSVAAPATVAIDE